MAVFSIMPELFVTTFPCFFLLHFLIVLQLPDILATLRYADITCLPTVFLVTGELWWLTVYLSMGIIYMGKKLGPNVRHTTY